jgi:RNA 2',3'-cyclic 3'-phosphodiesterase
VVNVRAFIAIALPGDVHAELSRLQDAFRRAFAAPPRSDEIRWTRPEGIHLTLKFLGQISDDQAQAVASALEALDGFEKFSVEVRGFGFFPDVRRPRVFWAGLEAPPALARLASQVEDSMAGLGFVRESRPFAPHLTLTRFKNPSPRPALEKLAAQEGARSLGRFEVSEFFLFESKLNPRGAEYRKVARFPK